MALVAVGCAPGGGESGGSKNVDKRQALGEIEVINRSSVAGIGVAEVVIPLAEGVFEDAPNVRTEFDAVCQVHAMGARYGDGSLRYLRLEVPIDAEASARATLKLHPTSAPNPAFARHPAVGAGVGVSATFRAGGRDVLFSDFQVIEAGPLSQTHRARLRVPSSMLWAELTVTLYAHLPHARWTLQWGISDDRTTALDEDPGAVELLVGGAAVEFEFAAAKVLQRTTIGGVTTALLHQSGAIGDGQSQLVEGRFVFAGDPPPRVFAISKNWRQTGTFGPFGELLPELEVDPEEFDELVLRDDASHLDHPWARPLHGCNPSPSSTGTQSDFATTVMRADVLRADPRRLQSILRSVYQEACRTTHFREFDVSRVIVANHPDLLTLTGRPKYEGRGNDMLGKLPNVWVTNSMRGPSGQQWKGHDGQHLSINYLSAIALLTGNRFAREEMEHHCMLYLTGFTHESGSWNDSPGASRQVGRSSLAAIWMWLVTGREEIRDRLINRTRHLKALMDGQTLKLTVIAPRSGNTQWYPWEEGNATCGLAAVYKNFQTPEALELLHAVSRSVTMHAFAKLTDGNWRLGYQLPIEDAQGNAYVARNDRDFDNKAAGGGLTLWGIPAVFLAAEFHPDAAVRGQALTIIQEHYAGPISGLADDLQWICVSPNAARLAMLTSQ